MIFWKSPVLSTTSFLLTLGATTLPCLAQSAPVAQSRTMHGMTTAAVQNCTADSDSGDDAAPKGFAPWEADLSVLSTMCGATIAFVATQQSQLNPNSIYANGSAAFAHGPLPSLSSVTAAGDSTFSYTFHVPYATEFFLVGSWDQTGNAEAVYFRELILTGPDGQVFANDGSTPGYTHKATFTPGEYTIRAQVLTDYENNPSGEGANAYMAFEFNLTISPPPVTCPCDWDVSGQVNSQDFFSFVTDFFGDDADFNKSGATDSQDFFDFLACFFSTPEGCN